MENFNYLFIINHYTGSRNNFEKKSACRLFTMKQIWVGLLAG